MIVGLVVGFLFGLLVLFFIQEHVFSKRQLLGLCSLVTCLFVLIFSKGSGSASSLTYSLDCYESPLNCFLLECSTNLEPCFAPVTVADIHQERDRARYKMY